ncbi:MAG TPA: hypothetical protein VH331_00840 [Allosphingosinicella sp.]|jgi:hypothetical protein|nr:hypothetical protein [Allosphingosinicella sp.]
MKTNLGVFLALLFPAPAYAQGTQPAPATPPASQSAGKLADKLINTPGTNWTVFGTGQTNKRLETDGPQKYPCIRVAVTQKGKNAWDAGAVSPVAKAVAANDTVLIAVYLRAPDAKDGETLPLPFVGLSGSAAPYTTLISGPVAITNQWKQYYIAGRASQAAAAGGAQVSVHLAGDTHVIDLGPIRVFDLGDVDPARLQLPKN